MGCRNLLWHSQLHDEPTSFFSSSLSKLLTGDFLVDLINLEEESLPQNQQGIRKYRLKRNKKESMRKAGRKMWAAGTAPRTSAQHAE